LFSGSHSGDYEEYGLLGFGAVWFGENITFRRKIWPPSLELKNKRSKKPDKLK
jgi:hypothetical protein